MNAEQYLGQLAETNAATILAICEDVRARDDKLGAIKGLTLLAITRARQVERGEIKPPFDGNASRPRKPPMCEECGVNRADPPSRLCPGCQAYRGHTR